MGCVEEAGPPTKFEPLVLVFKEAKQNRARI
jgi:hypothetical protein